jgi:hypothetical protein
MDDFEAHELMRLTGLQCLGTFACATMIAMPVLAAEPTCGGVALPVFTGMADHDGAFAKKNGYFSGEGTLFKDGKNTCVAANIECTRDAGTCQIITVAIDGKTGKYPHIFGIFTTSPIEITKWTDNEIVAAGQSHLCKWTQLFVDYPAHTVRIITSSSVCSGSDMAPPQTEVLDLGSDPLFFQR